MAISKKRSKPKSLAHGRPPTAKPKASLSSRATRTLIRSHHTLEKQKATAIKNGHFAKAAELEEEIQKQGGLKKYQLASLFGQANERGGDSSKLLMEWLKPYTQLLKDRGTTEKICLLEVGALSTQNACSKSGLFDIERIDLNSQSEGIKQQDFMERPLPRLSAEKFEIISLSLVLNYVPDPVVRGDMLKRTLQFLQPPIGKDQEELSKIFPALFLVLPAPCVENSRYLDEARLEAIMNSIGYVKEQHKVAKKVVYYLWRATTTQLKKGRELFKKIEVRSGATRNNFAVVMK